MSKLWGFAINPDRKNAVLINLNCETDFVAKSEDFQLFLGNTLKLLVEQGYSHSLAKGDANIEGFLKDTKYSSADSLEQATKLLIAKTKEKVEFSRIRGLKGRRGSGSAEGPGDRRLRAQAAAARHRGQRRLDGAWPLLRGYQRLTPEETKELHRLVDNLSIHYLGNKSCHFYEDQIYKTLYEAELSSIQSELAETLKGKPKELQEKIVRGKLQRFLQEQAMEHQTVGFEESDFAIGQYLDAFQKKSRGSVRIQSAERFGL